MWVTPNSQIHLMGSSWMYTPLAKLSCLSSTKQNNPNIFVALLMKFLSDVGRVKFYLVQAVSWLYTPTAFPPFPQTIRPTSQPTNQQAPPQNIKTFHSFKGAVVLTSRLFHLSTHGVPGACEPINHPAVFDKTSC